MVSKFNITACLLVFGGISGYFFSKTPLPMPFLFGGLCSTALLVISGKIRQLQGFEFPNNFRLIFLSIIGVMIGGTLDREILSLFGSLWLSFLALVIFVLTAHGANYFIFRFIGNYDHVTAFYSGAPGGLVESMTLGEEAGADIRILSIQHFIRIILVILSVPLAFFVWKGELFGSASGLELSAQPTFLSDWITILILCILGIGLGKLIHFPAKQFIGPLLVGACASVADFPSFSNPNDLMDISQLVIGVALGTRFNGITGNLIVKTLWLGLISVFSMQIIGLIISLILSKYVSQDLEVLLICFAAGGVTEMSLIALSLSANPIYVTSHHIARIILTVFLIGSLKNKISVKRT